MREIKFRFWDNDLSQMSDGTSLENLIKRNGEDLSFSKQESTLPISDLAFYFVYYTPLEYTGLKDKNGKDIYEGDILHCNPESSYHFGDTGDVKYESDYGAFIVEGEYRRRQYPEVLTCDVAGDCNVIGNIYENPELLTTPPSV
jgi:uncharacterized phage protein (TIGR01671 family)